MNCILDLLNKDEYDKYIELKQYNKNEIIFSEGLVCNYIGVVLEGQLVISTITVNDKEEVINIINKNCVFGNNLIFSSSPIFLENIISQTNSRIAFISRNNLKLIFKDNKEFLYKYMELLSDQILIEKQKNKLLVHKNIRDRLLYYFNNEQKKKGQIRIKSIAELARILSLPRPSVSREIYKMVDDNIIVYNNKNIIIK